MDTDWMNRHSRKGDIDMAKNLLDESKVYLPNFYNNGEWVENPTLKVAGRDIDNRVIEFMEEYYRFLFNSTFLTMASLLWLESNLSSVKKTIELYNESCYEVDRLNMNTSQTNIMHDKKRLEKYFSPELFKNIMYYPEEHLEEAFETLAQLELKYMKKSKEYRESLVVKVPRTVLCKSVDDNTWELLKQFINCYSKERIKKIERLEDETVVPAVLGYYNYLISNNRLSEVDKQRLHEIRQLLCLE